MIDPGIALGRPVLAGTGIPTPVLAERSKAGDSIQDLASDYECERDLIGEAIRCELAAAQNSSSVESALLFIDRSVGKNRSLAFARPNECCRVLDTFTPGFPGNSLRDMSALTSAADEIDPVFCSYC